MIFVDYETRQVVANQPDQDGHLTHRGDLWIGLIPPEVIIANTAVKWAGVYWTMVIWQAISTNPVWRAEFLAHEAFHCIQAEIGLPVPEVPNANVHLDTLEGRYWRAVTGCNWNGAPWSGRWKRSSMIVAGQLKMS
jgi:hypothetical protein